MVTKYAGDVYYNTNNTDTHFINIISRHYHWTYAMLVQKGPGKALQAYKIEIL